MNSSLSVKSKFLPKNYNLTSLECTSNNENVVSFIKKNNDDIDYKIKANKEGKANVTINANDGDIVKNISVNVFEKELANEVKYNQYDSSRKLTKKRCFFYHNFFLIIQYCYFTTIFFKNIIW